MLKLSEERSSHCGLANWEANNSWRLQLGAVIIAKMKAHAFREFEFGLLTA